MPIYKVKTKPAESNYEPIIVETAGGKKYKVRYPFSTAIMLAAEKIEKEEKTVDSMARQLMLFVDIPEKEAMEIDLWELGEIIVWVNKQIQQPKFISGNLKNVLRSGKAKSVKS